MIMSKPCSGEEDNIKIKLDANSLDEWLENDLRASGILPYRDKGESEPVVKVEPVDNTQAAPPKPKDLPQQAFQPAMVSLIQSLAQLQHAMATMTATRIPIGKRPRSNDALDELAIKRQRNTDAARRSRLRKALKMQALERRVQELEQENEQLRLKIAVLESERDAAREKEKTKQAQVLDLEAQLAVAHKALMNKCET